MKCEKIWIASIAFLFSVEMDYAFMNVLTVNRFREL